MKLFILSSFCLLLFSSCEVLNQECPEKICTMEFRTVSVNYKDKSGSPLVIKDFSAVIKRTGASTQTGHIDTTHFKGSYSVASDNDLSNLLSEGDIIVVTATHPKTNQTKKIEVVVAGGKCACHIEKKSGPQEVIFD